MPKDSAEQIEQQLNEANPMKRFGRPEEIAKLLIFLAFEATYKNGI